VFVTVGPHNLDSPLPIGAFMYGFAPADSYGYRRYVPRPVAAPPT
jgi:hypothetical protein